jgi:hypothetical protein
MRLPLASPVRLLLPVLIALATISGLTADQAATVAVLQPSDVTFEGFRNIRTNPGASTWGKALSHRYVNGDLRFLTVAHPNMIHEYSIRDVGLGATVTTPTAVWNLPEGMVSDHTGIWYEEARSRLWLVSSEDYGEAGRFYPSGIATMTLGPGSEISNLKVISLQGISSKMVFGGVQPVPAWAQKALGCGPYAVGWGGYTSLMHETSRSSLGPVFICIPDPDKYPNQATVPRSAFKVLLDAGESRGVRKTIPTNFYDGGDRRENPSTRPTGRPAGGAGWQSPNRDGLGWFVWGDSYFNTGMWIEGPAKRGWVAIASLGAGSCWYGNSSLNCDGQQFEMHIWDPAKLGNGRLTRPDSMTELDLPRGNTRYWRDYGVGRITGATWDPRSGRMYLQGFPFSTDNGTGRLYSFIVNTGAR